MRIFVSYRREDSAAWAGRLYDALAARFGERNLFQDIVAVQPGETFTEAIERALSRCDAVLVVIGPRWLGVADADGARRLDDPDDSVRTELRKATGGSSRVIPVLVGGAALPTAAELPAELETLTQRQAVALRDDRWAQDVDALARALRGERPGRRRRRTLVVAAAAVIAAGAVGTGAVLLAGDDGGDGGSADDSTLTGCPGEGDLPEVALDPAPSANVDNGAGRLEFRVDAFGARDESTDEDSEWDVVVTVTATNMTAPPTEHLAAFYELLVDRVPFEPWCFGVPFGRNPLQEGTANVGRVGFLVPEDPATQRLELRVTVGEGSAQIEISRPTG